MPVGKWLRCPATDRPSGLCQPLAAHGGAEADEAQRARHGDGNPARPERHIDAIQGDGPPHHNPDQLQKRDQGKDGGGKRAKGSYGHCPSPMAHEDVLVPRPSQPKWGGAGAAATPLKQGSGLTEPFSMCCTIAVSRRRESGSLPPLCRFETCRLICSSGINGSGRPGLKTAHLIPLGHPVAECGRMSR